MPLNQGKHIIKEIEGMRCSLVEENVLPGRVDFLKKLLEHNGFNVKVAPNDDEKTSFVVGVTDLLFHPVIYVYELRLKTPDNKIVTPAYWLQLTREGIDKGEDDYYWNLKESGKSSLTSEP
ncbi:MAG: hypothetical protein GXO83_00245 [Chlorobi bacterium]|nr:hypothetical protein [Chlorobiota bacterium]